MSQATMNRRTFLKVSTLAGSGLLVGCSFSSPKLLSTPQASEDELGLWIRISTDNKITLIVPSSEMGQQAHTGQAMLLAEELEADWNSIKVIHPPYNLALYGGNTQADPLGRQFTGGSSSISFYWTKIRQVGAGAREMLIQAAANHWGVAPTECKAKEGEIIHESSGQSLNYGQLVGTASKLSPPDAPTLKSAAKYRLLGKSMPKLHTPSRVNGSMQYGTDVRRPGMLYAAVYQSPVFGGEVKSFEEKAAKSILGVIDVIPVPNGMAVVANTTWQAQKGLEALNLKFQGGDTEGLGKEEIKYKLGKALDEMGKAKISAEKVLDVEYEMPFLHHATMEPMNCTAHYHSDLCEIWVPTQAQSMVMKAAKDVTGFSEDQIKIHTIMMGGSFGRKISQDYVKQAIIVSKAVNQPVQVIWSREEDTQHGMYRPTSMSRFQVGIGKDGMPVRWENQIAQPNLAAWFVPIVGWFNFDPMAIAASVHSYALLPKHFYNVEEVEMSHTPVDLKVPIGPWRSPPNSLNVFYTDSVIDELSYLADIDPLEYRLKLLKSSRHKSVLEQVAKQAGWGTPLPEGHGRGISMEEWPPMEDSVTIAAEVAEVSVSKRGKLKVHRVDCVVDCGFAVNPDSVKAQIEGSIIMGMSAALFEKITINEGKVEQGNFDDYRIARMRDTPEINVTIVDSKSDPTGTGEPATSPIVPAITNAIFAATGKRIRKLPIGKQKLV